MKKRKRDIISVILIILVMALIFLGDQLAKKNTDKENAPTDIWICRMIE